MPSENFVLARREWADPITIICCSNVNLFSQSVSYSSIIYDMSMSTIHFYIVAIQY